MDKSAGVVPRLEAKVRPYQGHSEGRAELLGFAELVVAGAFVIKGIRILSVRQEEGDRSEPFLSYPSRRGRGETEKKYFDIAHPITKEARARATEVVLEAYEEARTGGGVLS